VACNDVKRGQGVGLIWAGGCMSREGGLYKYEQVHTWSCSSGLEEMTPYAICRPFLYS
jgi:hypothetical protein